MKIGQHFTFYLFFLFSLGSFPVSGKTAIKTQSNLQQATIPLSKAIDEVADVYQVNIVYDVEQVAGKQIKNWAIQHQSVEEELKELQRKSTFNFKKLGETTYIIKVTKITANKEITKEDNQKQTISKVQKALLTVSGTIYDTDTDEPLIGVNILIKGKDVGTATDFDGKFSLEVKEGATLIFSYIGYNEKEIKVRNAKLGEIYLESDAKQLEEVVVVGYGTQKRSDLTGALSSVSEKEIKALPATGLDQALQGRAAGVQVTQNSGAPGGGVSIRIRGIGSTLSAEPLYVIDGIPVVNDNQGSSSNFSELDGGGQNSNALNTVNPSDIESIEILKDASATAIYGARAANGVVLITTKRGKAGKSKISLESYYGTQELSSKVPVLDLRQYAEYYGDIGFELIEEFRNPELLGKGTDWQDAVFRRASTQNFQLTVSGGSEKTKFALSGGYNFKEGIVVGSDFTRLSAKINIDHSFSDRVRIGNSFLVKYLTSINSVFYECLFPLYSL